MNRYRLCILCAILSAVVAWLVLGTATASAQAKPVSFINEVAPILKESCFACHDAKKRSGKFDMTTFEKFMAGGNKEAPVAAGKPDESLLIELVNAKGTKRMPPEGKGQALNKAQISVISNWIKQ